MTEWTVNNKLNAWYQKRYHIKLPKEFETKSEIYFGGSSFSPATLFALAEPGVWYDPSDLTTLFTDPAGTTPVTAPGNTVGLMLDKSRGGVGTNGASRRNLLTYSEDFYAVVWPLFGGASKTGTNIAVAPDGTTTADGIRLTTAGTGSNVYQQPTYTVAAVPYTFSCWVKRNAASDQTFQLFNNLQGAQSASGNLTATDTWQRFSHTSTSNSGTANMLVGVIGNTSGTQADVLVWGAQLELGSTASAYQRITSDWPSTLPGAHATQATIAARPTYSIEPVGGRRNLLTWSEDYSNAVWTQGSTVGLIAKASVSTDKPDGTTGTVSTLAFPAVGPGAFSVVFQNLGATYLNVPLAYSVWLRVASGTSTIYLSVEDTAAGPSGGNFFTSPALTLTTAWQRFTLTGTRTSATGAAGAFIGFDTRAAAGQTNAAPLTVQVFGAQLETGSTATNYQRVTTQHDVTEAGVASVSYLYFDGAGDAMATSTITPGIDKAQIFAGVRRIADTIDAIAEFSTNWNASDGSFLFWGGTSMATGTGPGFNSGARGNAAAAAVQAGISPTTFAPPVSAVLTVTHDIAGDLSSVRGNGVAGVNGTADKGTGNFLAYPLNIGRRFDGSFPLEGHLYSLITRFGPNLDAPTIASTEAYVAGKTGIVI